MIVHALQTVLHLYKKYLSGVKLPRILLPILNIAFTNGVPSTIQSMHNHMVGRAESFVSPFYSISYSLLVGFRLHDKYRTNNRIY